MEQTQVRLTTKIVCHQAFRARKLCNTRPIWVYLPPGYEHDTHKRYHVLYAHDGNNLFYPELAFLGVDWQLDQTAERLIRDEVIKPIIIVAISNTPQRDVEYTHKAVPAEQSGKADLYADFIINDLRPFINAHYRTLTEPENTAVLGSSFGGLVSLYLGWRYSQYFQMVGAMSPSIWWAQRDILDMIRNTSEVPRLKIWLDMGTAEEVGLRDTRDVRDALLQKGFKLNYNLKYYEAPGAAHNEAAWAARVDRVLKFFFRRDFWM